MKSEVSSYDLSVFINCPFDAEYTPLLRAIVFAVIECGFAARTALDTSDASVVRIHKIYDIIGTSRLSIHDLSRTQLDPNTHLPRFNMPLELGIFLGAKFLGDAMQRRKACLVFDEKPYRYQAYLSDVAGQDISWHGNDERRIIFRVRDWLSHLSDDSLPSGSLTYDRFKTFQGELRHSCERLRQKPTELTHLEFLGYITKFKKDYIEGLIINGNTRIGHPTNSDIKSAIKRLSTDEKSIVIYEKGANGLFYMQALRQPRESRWELEYQDGDLEAHYRANSYVDNDSLVRSFQEYHDGEETWRTELRWEKVDL